MAHHEISRRAMLAGLGGALGAGLALRGAYAAPVKAKRTYPDIVGTVKSYTTRQSDTLLDLARANNLGYVEIIAANPGVDPWIPGDGTEITLPTAHILPDAPREGLVLNVAELRLYYFPTDGGPVETYPIGVGDVGWKTPIGTTKVVRKQKNPTWYVPKSIMADDPGHAAIVPPGPDNPLGNYAMYLGWPAYLIHGTNKPDGVGRRASHGCVRMYPEAIESLFPRIAVGTPVTVVDQQAKFGWRKGELYAQIHLSQPQAAEIEETGTFTAATIPDLAYRAVEAAGPGKGEIDWAKMDEAVQKRNGIPFKVLLARAAQTSAR